MSKPSIIQTRAIAASIFCLSLLGACSSVAQRDEADGASNVIPTAVATRSIQRHSIPQAIDPTTGKVIVSTANPNKRFVLTPLGESAEDAHTELTGSDYIKIIGSYFPKVVYRSPQLNAKLLMRVAPGTTFPLQKLDDGWYRINTEKGVGFLRTVDGEPISAEG